MGISRMGVEWDLDSVYGEVRAVSNVGQAYGLFCFCAFDMYREVQ